MQSKKLYIRTREHSRNSSLLCVINVKNGGMTKGFTSLDELATHLYGKYGENWPKVHKNGFSLWEPDQTQRCETGHCTGHSWHISYNW